MPTKTKTVTGKLIPGPRDMQLLQVQIETEYVSKNVLNETPTIRLKCDSRWTRFHVFNNAMKSRGIKSRVIET